MLIGAPALGPQDSAYVHRHNGAQWVLEQKLIEPEGSFDTGFGGDVAIRGDVVVVGARGAFPGGAHVFRFDSKTGAWIHERALIASDGEPKDQFGRWVAFDGETILVGAPLEGEGFFGMGAAYIFALIGSEWEEQQKLVASDGTSADFFGDAVEIYGTTVIIGAHWDTNSNGENAGSAYLFDLNCDGPALRIVGSCPGRMGFEASNVTPGGQVAFFHAFGEGSATIPAGNPCAGTTLGLNTTVRLGTVVSADANDVATVIANIPSKACSKTFVQALDLESCATSNVTGH